MCLLVVCGLLFDGRCLVIVACCGLFVDGCLLIGDCSSMLFVSVVRCLMLFFACHC